MSNPIMYISVNSVAQANANGGSALFNPPGVVPARQLATKREGQYFLLSSLTLQLHYPNTRMY